MWLYVLHMLCVNTWLLSSSHQHFHHHQVYSEKHSHIFSTLRAYTYHQDRKWDLHKMTSIILQWQMLLISLSWAIIMISICQTYTMHMLTLIKNSFLMRILTEFFCVSWTGSIHFTYAELMFRSTCCDCEWATSLVVFTNISFRARLITHSLCCNSLWEHEWVVWSTWYEYTEHMQRHWELTWSCLQSMI